MCGRSLVHISCSEVRLGSLQQGLLCTQGKIYGTQHWDISALDFPCMTQTKKSPKGWLNQPCICHWTVSSWSLLFQILQAIGGVAVLHAAHCSALVLLGWIHHHQLLNSSHPALHLRAQCHLASEQCCSHVWQSAVWSEHQPTGEPTGQRGGPRYVQHPWFSLLVLQLFMEISVNPGVLISPTSFLSCPAAFVCGRVSRSSQWVHKGSGVISFH